MENFNNKVVEELANKDTIKGFMKLLGKGEDPDNLKDLEQDVYVELLEMKEDFIKKLYENGKVDDFVFIMLKNNIMSKNSRYYYKYKKNLNNTITLEDYEREQQGED